MHKGQVCTRILANWRNPRPVDAQQSLLVLATDGSGRGGQAGWGLTTLPPHPSRQPPRFDGFESYSHRNAVQ